MRISFSQITLAREDGDRMSCYACFAVGLQVWLAAAGPSVTCPIAVGRPVPLTVAEQRVAPSELSSALAVVRDGRRAVVEFHQEDVMTAWHLTSLLRREGIDPTDESVVGMTTLLVGEAVFARAEAVLKRDAARGDYYVVFDLFARKRSVHEARRLHSVRIGRPMTEWLLRDEPRVPEAVRRALSSHIAPVHAERHPILASIAFRARRYLMGTELKTGYDVEVVLAAASRTAPTGVRVRFQVLQEGAQVEIEFESSWIPKRGAPVCDCRSDRPRSGPPLNPIERCKWPGVLHSGA
jgi:hypothetical protein